MQSPTWYIQRLRAMSPDEMRWRLFSAVRDRMDRVRAAYPAWLADAAVHEHAPMLATPEPPRLCDLPAGAWSGAAPGSPESEWRARLTTSADRLLEGRIRVFGRELHAGPSIEWNREYVHGTRAPLAWASSIDYRDLAAVGDAKIIWEPNRHHHLVVLARAYRATGDTRYAACALNHIASWLDQCPFGCGINWRSPLELAIRLINWTWTFDFVRDSGQLTPELCCRFLQAVHLQMRDITRKYSRGSSANNHLIGEAAGVFVASSYFSCLSHAREWRERSYDILIEQVLAQTFEDGGSREQATEYHLFVFQLLLVAGIAGRHAGMEFPRTYWARLERMLDFAAIMSAGGPLPAFGDSDMGYVLELGQDHQQADACLSIGAELFGRPDLLHGRTQLGEPIRWLPGAAVRNEAKRRDGAEHAPASRALPESGYYVLRSRLDDSHHEVAVVVDCGPLGFTALAAHGHADALSIVVRAFGRELLVDPGTFDYFTYPEWRTYFRSTRAHNTVMVDGVDQSLQRGPFLWSRHATARCVSWEPDDVGGLICGEHDGYTRLDDPVVHRRSIRLAGLDRMLMVRDDLFMAGEHDFTVSFHFAEDVQPHRISRHEWGIPLGAHSVRFVGDPRLEWSAHSGAESPIAGWVSPAYHVKRPSVTLTGHLAARGNTTLECSFEFCPEVSLSVTETSVEISRNPVEFSEVPR